MSLRKPLIAALVAALMFLAWLGDRTATRNARLREVVQARLIPFDAMDATRVTLDNEKGRFVVERRGDDWFVTEPVEVLADATQVRTLIDTLHAAKKMEPFEADSLAPYGLDEPSPTVTVEGTLDGEKVERRVLLGADSSRVGRIYAMTEGDEEVSSVGNWVRGHAARGLDLLRDKTLLRFEKGNVESFAVSTAGATLTVERVENLGTPWRVAETGAPASAQVVDRALSALSAGRVVRVEDSPTTPLAELGLERPTAEARFKLTEGERTLKLGARVEGENAFYALSSEQPGVCVVAARNVADLLLPAGEWTTAQFVWHGPTEFARVTASAGSGSMTLLPAPDGSWTFADMPDVPVHPDKAKAFIDALAALAGTKREAAYAGTEEDDRRFGFRQGTYRVEIETKDGKREGFVQGRTDTVEGTTWMKRLQDATAWSMPADQLHRVVKLRRDLEDRRVAPDFVGKVASMKLTFFEAMEKEVSLLVEKRNDVWRILTPGQSTLVADVPSVETFLRTVRELEWADIAVLKGQKPRQRHEFLDVDGKVVYWIEVYRDGEKWFFRAPDNLFFAPPEQAQALDAALTLLIGGAKKQEGK